MTDQGREANGSVKEVFISTLWTTPGTQKIMSTGKLVSKGKKEEGLLELPEAQWWIPGAQWRNPGSSVAQGRKPTGRTWGYPRVVWQEGM